jgi:hypothetical protein
MEKSALELAIKEREEVTPEKGYNVVTLDDFSRLGEQLTIVKHTDTYQEALKFKEEFEKLGATVYIYSSWEKKLK